MINLDSNKLIGHSQVLSFKSAQKTLDHTANFMFIISCKEEVIDIRDQQCDPAICALLEVQTLVILTAGPTLPQNGRPQLIMPRDIT